MRFVFAFLGLLALLTCTSAQEEPRQPTLTKEMWESMLKQLTDTCRDEVLEAQQLAASSQGKERPTLSETCRGEITAILQQFSSSDNDAASASELSVPAPRTPSLINPVAAVFAVTIASLGGALFIIWRKSQQLQSKTSEQRELEKKRMLKKQRKGKLQD